LADFPFFRRLLCCPDLPTCRPQYRAKIPSFQEMPVANMVQFLAPHRLVKIDEDVITAQAFHTFVQQRVTGGAVVNQAGVLVDVLSSRDLRGIGRRGQDFELLWSIVREFKASESEGGGRGERGDMSAGTQEGRHGTSTGTHFQRLVVLTCFRSTCESSSRTRRPPASTTSRRMKR